MKIKTMGLIAGTGMNTMLSASGLTYRSDSFQSTPFGGVVKFNIFELDGVILIVIDRHHSSGQFVPPSRLNWQGYMYALWKLEVQFIIATSAVGAPYREKGGLNQGSIIAPSNAIDYVHGNYSFEREGFADSGAFYRPADALFCPYVKQALEGTEYPSYSHFVLANSIRRPAYETSAEMAIRVKDGVDIVGMPTAFPESLLAGELAIPYGVLCGVSNLAPAKHNGATVEAAMKKMMPIMVDKILYAIDWLAKNEHPLDCPCRRGREKSVFEILGIPSL